MNSLVKFIKSSGIYFVGNVLTKLVSFFLLPLYTTHIDPSKMGYFNKSYSIISVLITVVFFEVWSVIMLFIMNRSNEKDPYKTLFNGTVLFSLSMAIYLLGGGLLGLLGIIDSRLCVDYLLYIIAYGAVIALQNCYSYIARAFGHNTTFALSGIVGTLLTSLSNIVMILWLNMTIESLYLAAIFGLLVQVIIMECKVHVLRHLSFRYLDKSLLWKMLKFSLPLSLNSACFWFLSGFNQVGISLTLEDDAAGIYSVAAKFTYALTLVSGCFNMAWQELAYSFDGDKNDKGKLYTLASNYYLRFLMFGILLLLPAVQAVYPFLVRGEYTSEVYALIPLYMLAAVASVFSNFLGSIFAAEHKTNVIFFSTLLAAITNVAVFFALVYTLPEGTELQAASIALFLGYFVNIVTRLLLLRRHIAIRLPGKLLLTTAALFIGTSFIYLTQNMWDYTGESVIFLPSKAVITAVTFLLLTVAALFAFRELLQLLLTKAKDLREKKRT